MSQQTDHYRIRTLVAGNDVVLFMKGTKNSPQCGFSDQVAQILQQLGVDYKDINVLDDATVRDGIKSYTNWPTIPQPLRQGRVRRWLRHLYGRCSNQVTCRSCSTRKACATISTRPPRDLESWVLPLH